MTGNTNEKNGKSFSFWGCSELPESLGVSAANERDLLERLETVDPDSIYYHTVRSLLRRQVLRMSQPNDFAAWVAEEVRDPALAERLALQSPFDFDEIEAFREHLLATLDDHLMRLPFAPRTITGRPFHFLVGHLHELPLDLTVGDLVGFRRAVEEVDESSIYYHAVESMGRLGNPRSDFAAWVDEALGRGRARPRDRRARPFVLSLDGLRRSCWSWSTRELARPGSSERDAPGLADYEDVAPAGTPAADPAPGARTSRDAAFCTSTRRARAAASPRS